MELFTFSFREEEDLGGGCFEVKEKVTANCRGTPSTSTIPS